MAASPAGPLTDHERYFFDLNGFVVRRGVLTPNEVEALNTAIELLGLPEPGSDISSQRFEGHLSSARCFRDLIDHDAVLRPLIEMCGPVLRLDHAYGIVMSPGQRGLGLHGGGTPHDPSQYYDVRGGRMYNGLVGVQWALVDHRPGDGGFGCVAGSHRANFALPSPFPREWVTEVTMDAGDLVFFTEALTHCTLPWNGRVTRRTLLYKYAPGHVAWATNYERDLRDLALSGLLTPRQTLMMTPPSVHPRVPLV
jgi:hypothetical protein